MKLDLAARREELLRERAEIEQQLVTKRAEYDQVRAEHEKVRAEHEQAIWRRQGELRVINARLEEIENIVAALGPDSSGHIPIAGGPVEPIRRSARNSNFRELILSLVKKYPGNPADTLAQKIGQSSSRTLTALAYWETKGTVQKREGERWWPIETLSEGPQDTESGAEAQPPTGSETPTTARARLRGEAEEIDGRYRPIVREET